jgi:hypothetical protein
MLMLVTRTRIQSFDDEYEYHFIEHEHDFLTQSSIRQHQKALGPVRIGSFPGMRLAPVVQWVCEL